MADKMTILLIKIRRGSLEDILALQWTLIAGVIFMRKYNEMIIVMQMFRLSAWKILI